MATRTKKRSFDSQVRRRNAVKKAGPLSLRDSAYEAIKRRIITCAFRPGDRINEVAISDLIGVGRTPVHQALDRLRLEGMVDVIPRKGVIVKPVSDHEIIEIADVRALNETYCARLAAERAEDADLRALRQIVANARDAIAAKNVELMMTLDREFHLRLARASRNDELADVIRRLNERSLRFWFISFTSDHHRSFQKQHEAIVEAVSRRNGDAAERAMRAHIDAFRGTVARSESE
jgi:DNA-binding GntR family transcriptional regulator